MLQTLLRLAGVLRKSLRSTLQVRSRPDGRWLEGRHRLPGGARFLRANRQPELAYRLFLPGGRPANGRLPLLVMLHGCKQDAQVFADGTRMNALANRDGFAVLYPEQNPHANSMRCWNWFNVAVLGGRGEARLIIDMIFEVVQRHPIDPARIYVAGISAGGAMAQLLATRFPQFFAGCAVHSGLMYRAASTVLQAFAAMREGSRVSPDLATQSASARAAHARFDHDLMPTIVIHGDRDEVVHARNAEQTVEQVLSVAQNAGPGAVPLVDAGLRTVRDHGRPYLIRDYHRAGRSLVRSITIQGLGHAWSGGDAKLPFNDALGPDSSLLLWEFLSRHRRNDGGIAFAPRAASTARLTKASRP
jgi:poly(hydroxyalkanoate) depolymerase family esterase